MVKTALITPFTSAKLNRRILERRSVRRCELPLRLAILPFSNGTILHQQTDLPIGETRDISTGGIYFTTNEMLAPGSKLFFGLILSAELTTKRDVFVCAKGTVVRTEKKIQDGIERAGVAARIESYEIIKEDTLSFA
jgi:hypothetical protein